MTLSIRRPYRWALTLLVLSGACDQQAAPPKEAAKSPAALMTPQDLQSLPSQPPDQRVAYGTDSSQYGELRLPASRGPIP